MERVAGRQEKIEGHCSTGQSPHWAVVPMEEGGEEEEEKVLSFRTGLSEISLNHSYFMALGLFPGRNEP